MYGYFRLADGCMRQQGISRQVTASIYSGNGGLHLSVDKDISAFRSFQAQILQSEAFHYRTAPDTHQKPFGNDRTGTVGSFIIHLDKGRSFGSILCNRYHFCTQHELDSPLSVLCTEHTRQLSVHTASQYLVQHLDDGYLHSQAVEERSELHTDDTAADDGKRSGQFLVIQCITMSPVRHLVYAGNGRDKGFGTGAEQQVIAFVGFSAALHMILVRHCGPSADNRHTMGSQLSFDSQYQLAHYLLLASNNLGQIERYFGHTDRILCSMAGSVIGLGRIQQGLGRDTPFIQAHSTETLLLK